MTDREWRIQTLVHTFGLPRDEVKTAMDLLERSSEGLIGFFLIAYLAPQYAPYRDSLSFLDILKYLLEVVEDVEKEVRLVEGTEAVESALEFSTRALSAVLSDVPLLVASQQTYERMKAGVIVMTEQNEYDEAWVSSMASIYRLPVDEIQDSLEFLAYRVGKVQAPATLLRLLPMLSQVADRILPMQVFTYIDGMLAYWHARNRQLLRESCEEMNDLASIYIGNADMLDSVIDRMLMDPTIGSPKSTLIE